MSQRPLPHKAATTTTTTERPGSGHQQHASPKDPEFSKLGMSLLPQWRMAYVDGQRHEHKSMLFLIHLHPSHHESSFLHCPQNYHSTPSKACPWNSKKQQSSKTSFLCSWYRLAVYIVVSDSKGFEGQYIRFHSEKYNHQNEADRLAGAKFKIAPGLDPSLRDLTTKIIKIATWYGSVSEFVNVHSKPDYGVVNHALCAAIRKLLRVPPQLAD